ncbi:MAG TPA: hypothetical protein VKT77_09105 [Chthonomonadaceae bacterium]|nr:hypothetical protein [Chthonomonadaceae bacterium]
MVSIVATAPGRCGLLGNPSDMYGGSVISCTTVERAECRLEVGGRGISLRNEGKAAELFTRADLALQRDDLDIARAALTHFEIDPAHERFSMSLQTEIPMRAGLAGSTAMLATIVGALYAYRGATPSPYHVAETMRKVEARIMHVVCGFQDQHMAVFGGLNFMEFRGKERLEQEDDEPLAIVEPLAALVELPGLVLAHTGVEHHSGTVHSSPRQRWLEGDPLVRSSYARIAEIARTGKRAMLERKWGLVGDLMMENHRLVADLGGSGPENERLIGVARGAGAIGAKLAGAGGGGTILALTSDPDRLAAALHAAGAERILRPAPQPGLTITAS